MTSKETETPPDRPGPSGSAGGQYLNREDTRREAIWLARMERELSDLIHAYPPAVRTRDDEIMPRVYLTRNQEYLSMGDYSGEFARGIGSGYALYIDYRTEPEYAEVEQLFGVLSPRALHIENHMDDPTMRQAAALYAQGHRGRFRTSYYFDQQGHYGKLAWLVASNVFSFTIADGRPNVIRRFDEDPSDINYSGKIVVSKMTPSDFELVGWTLTHLIRRLKKDY